MMDGGLQTKDKIVFSFFEWKIALEQDMKTQKGSRSTALIVSLTSALHGSGRSTPLPAALLPG
jgi:hypothetical protein